MGPRSLFHVVACLLVFAACAPAYAQSSFAVVDIEKLLNDSKAALSIEKQLDAKREAFQKEFGKMETELREIEKNLIEQKSAMTAEEFTQKRNDYESRLMDTRKLFQQRRNSLDHGLGEAMRKLQGEIVKISAELAEEKGYDLILTRDSVVIAAKELDITGEVLKRLDAKVSDIKLEVKE